MKPVLEALETRELPSAGLSLSGGLLFVTASPNAQITAGAFPDGTIALADQSGWIPIYGLPARVQTLDLIFVQGGAGMNVLTINPALGALPVEWDARAGAVNAALRGPQADLTLLPGAGINAEWVDPSWGSIPAAVPASPADLGPQAQIANWGANFDGMVPYATTTRQQEADIARGWALSLENAFRFFGEAL